MNHRVICGAGGGFMRGGKVCPVQSKSVLNSTVLIAALGYFVDIYDLLLFGIVRVASLKGIGVPEDQLLEVGVSLINKQMAGMLIGGIIWGVIGDKKGRVSVLFGSILMYSIANLLNAYVNSVEWYGVLRFFAGVGLAGELGAAVTLVSETLHKDNRGLGTTIVATVGVLGAVFASFVGDHLNWQNAYFAGGLMGLALLFMRMTVLESGMFQNLNQSLVPRGDFRILFNSRDRFFKYLRCILMGVPIWFVIGILITFSPELAKELGVQGSISASKAILYCYAGLSLGDFASGYLSQVFRTRKKVILFFLILTLGLVAVYLFSSGLSTEQFYLLCAALGVAIGYWAVFVITASEQFGTNMRATVTTTVPNFVRGSVVLLTSSFQLLKSSFGLGLVQSAWIVGLASIIIAVISLIGLKETFSRDLNYLEAEK